MQAVRKPRAAKNHRPQVPRFEYRIEETPLLHIARRADNVFEIESLLARERAGDHGHPEEALIYQDVFQRSIPVLLFRSRWF